jgi:hypothetical protein
MRFLALTGYTVAEFQALLVYLIVRFRAYVSTKTLAGKPRQKRPYVEYRNSPLPTMEDKLLFILVYLKTYNLQQVQGQLFGMHQPEANRWIHRLLPLLKQALADCHELPARNLAELELAAESARLFFQDGTERPIQRPQDPQTQKSYYLLPFSSF